MIRFHQTFHAPGVLYLIIGLFLICISCGKEQTVYEVEPDFQPYVDRFVDEAAMRGIPIDFSDTGLRIVFRRAVDTETGGVCRGDHLIEIEKFYWDDLNDWQKEGLIFHELGHCELDRGHRNDLLANGEWASRMRGSPIPEDLSSIIHYGGSRHQYYVNELFQPDLPEPDWAKIKLEYGDINQAMKELTVELENVASFEESLRVTFSDDFEIEVLVDAGFSESWVGIQWGGSDHSQSFRVLYNNLGEFLIDSGSRLFGPMRHFLEMDYLENEENKITVRRQSDKYFIFLNEQFIYWFDYVNPQRSTVSSLVSGQTPANFVKLSVNKLR